MKHIITIGGATQDIFIFYTNPETLTKHNDHDKQYLVLEEGQKIEVTKLHYALGGGALNTAVTFHRLGLPVIPYCKIGNDAAGDIIKSSVNSWGMSTEFILSTTKYQTGTSFILPSPTGNRTILAYRGANTSLCKGELPFNSLKADIFYISSLAGSSAALLPIICEYAKKTGIYVATNPGSGQLRSDSPWLLQALPTIDTLVMNTSEAQLFMQALCVQGFAQKQVPAPSNVISSAEDLPLRSCFIKHNNIIYTIDDYFDTIHAKGPQIAIVTDGACGVYVSTPTKRYFHPSIPVKPLNTVGAGDAFSSCFVGMLTKGHDIPIAILAGVHNSASVLTHNDAQTGILNYQELIQKTEITGYSRLVSWDK